MQLILLALMGCLRGPVDGLTTQRVVPAALRVPDVDRVCRTGGALGHALVAVPRRTPHRAMVIADATAALCDAEQARERDLSGLVEQGAGRIDLVRDHREAARRLRRRGAARFASAFAHTEAVWPWIGETCGRVRPDDELTFLVGLVSGTLGMLEDKSSGSEVGVPLDTLARVGRSAACLDSATWWEAPVALQAAAWTVVPGSAPPGVDPWEALEQAARRGAPSGVRLGWALTAVVAANAGRDELVRRALSEASESYASVPAPADWALLDAFAHDLLQFEADRLSIAEQGHRTAGLSLPAPARTAAPLTDDPFADDPVDPFAEPPEVP